MPWHLSNRSMAPRSAARSKKPAGIWVAFFQECQTIAGADRPDCDFGLGAVAMPRVMAELERIGRYITRSPLKLDDPGPRAQPTTDPTGTRARALQRQVDAAPSGGTIRLHGQYNFSARSLVLDGRANLSLLGSGPDSTTLVFRADTGGDIDPGVNITNSERCGLSRLSIDYSPKPRTCFCFSRATSGTPPFPPCRPQPDPACPPAAKGITLHFQNSSSILVEDVTLHAAPFMAVTSFNGKCRC